MRLILSVVAAYCAASGLLDFLAGPVGTTEVCEAIGVVHRAAGGLVQAPVIFSTVFFVMLGALLLGAGRLRCRDFGWRLNAVGPGLLVTAGFCAAILLGLCLWVLLTGAPLRWNGAWTEHGKTPGELLVNSWEMR